METTYHPISLEDRAAVAALREAIPPGKGNTFAPDMRPMFDEMIGQTPAAPGVTYEAATVGGVPGWWRRPAGALPGAALLYLHGGAYGIGSARAYQHFVGQIAARAGAVAFAPEYRLAPEHPFPAAVGDALAAYSGLAAQGFTTIALVGDSAGGGLALVTLAQAAALARSGSGVKPRCAAVLSSWNDLSLSGASMTNRAAADPLLTRDGLAVAAARYLDGHDPCDPLASPLFGDLAGLPPVRLDVGEDEILLDDSRRYAEQVSAEGGNSELHIWTGMMHVFQASVGVLAASETALDDIGGFLHNHLTSG
jgi:monoterpene epsilon-lactone hydrolase